MKKFVVLALSGMMMTLPAWSQHKNKKTKPSKVAVTAEVANEKEIAWLTFEQLEAKMKIKPKPVIVDFYTDWCGWCKVMDKKTYSQADLIKYVNQHFYAVKFDAEQKAPVNFLGKTYEFVPEYKANRLAAEMMGGRMSYPTTVFLSENLKEANPVPGYQRIDQMEMILKFFIEAYPKKMKWEDFSKDFKASWNPVAGD